MPGILSTRRSDAMFAMAFPALAIIAVACCPPAQLQAQPLADPQQTSDRPSVDRPNIVLVMADDQGWGDVGYRDHPVLKTPVMDEMAASGLLLNHFYAAAPVCSPTRGSVLTGRHPNRFGCFSWGHDLRPEEITFAEVLQTAGYRTGHFGKWHLGSLRKSSPTNPGASGFEEWLSSPNYYENDPLLCHNGTVVETQGESSHVTAEAANEFITQAASAGEPFLAVVWFGNPHAPHVGVDEYREMYADQPKAKREFFAEITAMDHALGEIRNKLRELDIAENTLLWYTSDNGAIPVGSTGGLAGRKGNLGDGGIRVPAMVEWPARIKQPRVSMTPCGTVDIYSTLLDIVDVQPDHQPPLDGESLLPLFEGGDWQRSQPLGFWKYPQPGIRAASQQLMQELLAEQRGEKPAAPMSAQTDVKQYPLDEFPGGAALIDGDYKLRRVFVDGEPHERLFHLQNDPSEKQNIASQEPQRVQRMSAQLTQWQQSVLRSLNRQDYQGN